VEALALWEQDALRPVPQDHARATYAPKLTRATAQVRWSDPAERVARLIRGLDPKPGAWTELDGVRLKLGPIALDPGSGDPGGGGSVAPPDLAPGELQVGRNAVLVGTGSRPVRLGDVQAPGKRRMTAPEWARGLRSGGPVRFG
jgi:methionyl-tRNA formyltransferase